MAGIRGFNDPNVQVNPDGKPVWYQQVDTDMSTKTDYLLLWYLGYEGGSSLNAIQCMIAGSNSYEDNHGALNNDLNNYWARNNTPSSWGYLKRQDIPVQFAIAEGWTSGDMYQEVVSGSVNVPGGPQSPGEGGVYIDNNEAPITDTKLLIDSRDFSRN